MAEDLVLQHPHVHEWIEQYGSKRGRIWHGPVTKSGPPIGCECGEVTGDWSDVTVFVEVSGSFDMKVKDIWPSGRYPVPVTAEAVRAQLEKKGPRRTVMDEMGMSEFDVTVSVGPHTATVWDWRRGVSRAKL